MTDTDHLLTLMALRKITAAMDRGTLSRHLHINRYPTQIVVDNTTAKDREWITKHFPGTVEDGVGHVTSRRGSERFEKVRYIAELREPTKKDEMWRQRPPRLEIWGIQVSHVCAEFTGSATDKGVVWKCRAYNCGKRITKTKARELGLLP